jgi:hypothetical protein
LPDHLSGSAILRRRFRRVAQTTLIPIIEQIVFLNFSLIRS